ncbi:BON domain-containing protein [Caballeronia sp. LP006]|jgi:osmotically-inducible protein OsmY|uniref:BON domain-containing protein n=1 Tax=unclassified Caballeronia TaxID=2646786 RepID=UPI002029667F|nr:MULTISPECIES: BON domain-containing protein [unclassified Caballeronia]MDR5772160.1 BON domain-containing protein [Caballeronia sp. LZ002]MDR5831747.1 BON domain-containing protein [Caballeronia sp. LP006]MDR5847594.1 BON domain-containing protein [Caballeronia sp. LZ003]
MRKKPIIGSHLLLAAMLALPVFALTAGCQSTPSREAAGDYASDASVTARVKAALIAEPGFRSLVVSVATYRGVVLLSGYVNSEDQIQKAISITRSVSGVQSVNNDLRVKTQQSQ